MKPASAIIHISDIECGSLNRAQARDGSEGYVEIAERMVTDIKNCVIKGKGVPKERLGLVLSGDVTEYGKADEYGKAVDFLSEVTTSLDISLQRVAIIPGNHDVNWAITEEAFKAKFPDASPDDSKQREQMRLAPEKLLNFGAFFRSVTGCDFGGPGTVISFPGFLDLGVALVGFDSAWPCTFHKHDNFGEIPPSIIKNEGASALKALLRQKPDAIPIALIHHCPLPLSDETQDDFSFLKNASQVSALLQSVGFGMILCGHEHQPKALDDARRHIRVRVAGSFGLNAEALINRYRGRVDGMRPNAYEILLIGSDARGEILYRRTKEPGKVTSAWVDDDSDGCPLERLRFFRPALDTVHHPTEEWNAEPVVGRPFKITDTEYVMAIEINVPDTPEVASLAYKMGQRTMRTVCDKANHFFGTLELDSIEGSIEADVNFTTGDRQTLQIPIPNPA